MTQTELLASQDVRSPVPDALPETFDFGQFLTDPWCTPDASLRPPGRCRMISNMFRPAAVAALRDARKPACAHKNLTVLRATTRSAFDDHETADVQCKACGGLFIATIYATDRETELSPMPAAKVAEGDE